MDYTIVDEWRARGDADRAIGDNSDAPADDFLGDGRSIESLGDGASRKPLGEGGSIESLGDDGGDGDGVRDISGCEEFCRDMPPDESCRARGEDDTDISGVDESRRWGPVSDDEELVRAALLRFIIAAAPDICLLRLLRRLRAHTHDAMPAADTTPTDAHIAPMTAALIPSACALAASEASQPSSSLVLSSTEKSGSMIALDQKKGSVRITWFFCVSRSTFIGLATWSMRASWRNVPYMDTPSTTY